MTVGMWPLVWSVQGRSAGVRFAGGVLELWSRFGKLKLGERGERGVKIERQIQ